MTISVGDKLPDATFLHIGPEGPAQKTVAYDDLVDEVRAMLARAD